MDTPREQQTKGMWQKFTGKVQEAWGDLTGDDIDRYEGKRDQLVGHINQKTGQSRADIERRLDEISRETNYNW
jgi:uncharacterized protein YjbJ (UPF0337 family)